MSGSIDKNTKTRLALISLMISTFAIGTTEFIIMGILPEVAKDLDVSISSTGLLVTGYAIGVVINTSLGLKTIPLVAAFLTVFMYGDGLSRMVI